MDPNQNPQPQNNPPPAAPQPAAPPYGGQPLNGYNANPPEANAPNNPGGVTVGAPSNGDQPNKKAPSGDSGKRRRIIIAAAGLLGLIIVIIIVIVVLLIVGHKPKKVAVAPPKPKLCYVRVAQLYCTNDIGNNRVRYTIPSLPQSARVTQLVANQNQSEFLAVANTAVSTNDIWILNSSLQQKQKVTLPSGVSAQTPSWSRGGKSILLEIDGAQNTRQIERYNIASSQLTQLTTSGYNTKPYETKNGDILYSYFSGQGKGGFYPYIMRSDGSNPQPLGNLTALKTVYGFSYDSPSDTIFVFGVNGQGKPAIVYGTTTDFLQGRVVQTLDAPVHPGDNVGYVTKNTIVVQHNDYATILNLTQNTQSATIHSFGPLSGRLTTNNFQKNPNQTEQKYDRIVNLNGAPPDFQGFIKGVFNTGDAKCAANQKALADGEEYGVVIYDVVSDEYASTSQGCGATNQLDYYYAKDKNGNWQLAFQTQGIPTCVDVNKHNDFTAQIIAQCFNPQGILVGNNPQTDTQKL
ncbi:MAG: TolB family protein [Candidatus Saccharimonadales bacterium]